VAANALCLYFMSLSVQYSTVKVSRRSKIAESNPNVPPSKEEGSDSKFVDIDSFSRQICGEKTIDRPARCFNVIRKQETVLVRGFVGVNGTEILPLCPLEASVRVNGTLILTCLKF
jgi:hypothetical protein